MKGLRKILEERIFDNRVELTLQEVLGIVKKEFHNIIDLMKRKRLSMELESDKPIEVKATHINEVVGEAEYADSHYMRPH